MIEKFGRGFLLSSDKNMRDDQQIAIQKITNADHAYG